MCYSCDFLGEDIHKSINADTRTNHDYRITDNSSSANNVPVSQETNDDGQVVLEYQDILFNDLALWHRTTTREPGELKYYLASEGEVFNGVTAITPFDWQIEAMARVENAINDRLGVKISQVSSIDEADFHMIIEDSYGRGGSINGPISSDNRQAFDHLTENFYELNIQFRMNAYAGSPQNYGEPGPSDPVEMTPSWRGNWERTFAHEWGHILGLEHPDSPWDGDYAVELGSGQATTISNMGNTHQLESGGLLKHFAEFDWEALELIWGKNGETPPIFKIDVLNRQGDKVNGHFVSVANENENIFKIDGNRDDYLIGKFNVSTGPKRGQWTDTNSLNVKSLIDDLGGDIGARGDFALIGYSAIEFNDSTYIPNDKKEPTLLSYPQLDQTRVFLIPDGRTVQGTSDYDTVEYLGSTKDEYSNKSGIITVGKGDYIDTLKDVEKVSFKDGDVLTKSNYLSDTPDTTKNILKAYATETQSGTQNYNSGNNIIIADGQAKTLRGLDGDDTYFVSNLLPEESSITIIDTSGANTIQIPSNTKVTKSQWAEDTVRLTFEDSRVITVNNADTFSYNLGGNVTNGEAGTDLTFSELALSFGVDDLSVNSVGTMVDLYII